MSLLKVIDMFSISQKQLVEDKDKNDRTKRNNNPVERNTVKETEKWKHVTKRKGKNNKVNQKVNENIELSNRYQSLRN